MNEASWPIDDGISAIFPNYGIVQDEGSKTARASTRFNTREGSVSLGQNGRVSVNGIPLSGEAVYKERLYYRFQIGYQYKGQVPASGEYEVVLSRNGTDQFRHKIAVLPFRATLPKIISKSKDLTFSIDGPALRPRENLVVYAEVIKGGGRYSLDPVAGDASSFTIPARKFAFIPVSSYRVVMYRTYSERLPEFPASADIGIVFTLRPIVVEIVD